MPLHQPNKKGFTLAEVLVTIGLAAILLVVYSVMMTGTMFLRRTQHNAQASSLIQEELDSLRLLPFTELLDRTDGNLLNIIFNRGDWRVVYDAGDGQGQRVSLSEPEIKLVGETGLLALPVNWQNDFTLSAKIKVLDASLVGWGAGLVFRYRDAENYYRFRFTSGGLAFDVVYHGIANTLWTQSVSLNKGDWYTLEVVANSNNITLKKDGATLTTIDDLTFSKGELGLASFDDALTQFDDVSLTVGATTNNWDFEANEENSYPEDWRRLGWPDLPSGNGTLTIDDYLSESTMKQATVNISWNESGRIKTVSGSTVIKD